jgi:hypothetical protein
MPGLELNEVSRERRDLVTRRGFLKVAAGTAVAGGAAAGACLGAFSGPGPGIAALRSRLPYRTRRDLLPPELTVHLDRSPSNEYVFLTPTNVEGSQRGALTVDRGGEPIWFRPSSGLTTNLQVQQYRGKPVLTYWEGELVPPGYGRGEYTLFDSTYAEVARVRAGPGFQGDLHEFTLTPQGTALLTAYRTQPFDLSSFGGPADGILLNSYFQEVDVATGYVLFTWDAYQHVGFAESYAPVPKAASQVYDFFHINSIDVDTDGNYIVSSRHTWTIYKIDRSSGAIIWRLGGKRSDFAMGAGTHFSWQHHVRHHGSGVLTVFDDGAGDYKVERCSRGLKLAVDTATMEATLLEQYLPHPSVLATSQGSVQLLADGEVFVGWGSEPYCSQYTSDAQLLYVGELPPPGESYRAFRFAWSATPSRPPDVAASRSDHDVVTVYASWNGATEVASWDVLGGHSPGSLERIVNFPRKGFETAMLLRSRHRHFAVRARDRAGRELATSGIVEA